MAHFYATVQGNRGEASRMGSEGSGISAHPRGWHVGVRVWGTTDDDGADVFHITATGGSTGSAPDQYLGSVRLIDGTPTFIPNT